MAGRWLAAPDDVQLGIWWVVVAAFRCLGSGVSGGHAGGHNCQRGLYFTTQHHKAPESGAGVTRNDSAAPELCRKRRFAGAADAGGGTRTPDTRIMIPWCFGSGAPFPAAVGHKRGHIRRAVVRHSVRRASPGSRRASIWVRARRCLSSSRMRVRQLLRSRMAGAWISSGASMPRSGDACGSREVEPGRQRGRHGRRAAGASRCGRPRCRSGGRGLHFRHVAGHDLHGVAELLGGAELDHLGAGVEDWGVTGSDVVRVAALEHLLGVA